MKTLMIIFYTIMIEVAIAELIFVILLNIHFIKQKKVSKKRDEEIHKAIMKKLEEKNNG